MTVAPDEPIGLVADVGGTNARLALVDAGGVIRATVEKRANDSASDFLAMAEAFLRGRPCPGQVVVAVAGPVGGTSARLTNRDWSFSAPDLGAALGGVQVTLINDLEALGHAVPAISRGAVEPLHSGADIGLPGQALVVGMGTGFNVASVLTQTGTVMTSELGQACLPSTVMAYLQTQLADTSSFATIEHLFSGVGLVRLGKALGLELATAAAIGASDDARALRAFEILTEATARLMPELAYMYFPRAGIYFNGSLARVMTAPDRRQRILARLRANQSFAGQFSAIPVYFFTSDTVALEGCAAVAMQQARRNQLL